MDTLDRFYRHLVATLRASFPHLLTQPFEVAELYQTILPYRHHRRALGLETNHDYEMTLLQLLSGAHGYLVVDERMRDALTRELAAPTPDPGRFREFASAQVSLAPDALERLDRGVTPAAKPPVVTAPMAPAIGPAPAAVDVNQTLGASSRPSPRSSAVVQPRGIIAAAGEHCRYCAGELPTGRRVVFCPHCGQDLSVRNCPACGSELELGWRYCVNCGRAIAADSGGGGGG